MRVLLIVADALRADHLSCYGYGRSTSPFLDELAGCGTRFSSFFAPNIPTEPAHTSIFSGEHAAQHSVMAHKEPDAALRAGTEWLPGLLKASGVRTVAFDNLADSKPWFGQGWTEYHNLRHGKAMLTAADINGELLPWLARNPSGPWFAFVHYWDAHSPYLPPERYRRRHYEGDRNDGGANGLDRWKAEPSYPFAYRWQVRHYEPFRDLDFVRGLYDGEISYLDDELRPVVSLLSDSGDDDFVVIFTADHGEVMYNRPGFFDHAGLYDDTIRVPLIMAGPPVPDGRVVEGMYQHLDLAPTVLGLFGQDVPASMTGTDLVEVASNGSDAPGYGAIYLSEGTWEIKWGIRTKDWKLVKVIDPGVHLTESDELFDLSNDPAESVNLATKYPDVLDRLELALRRRWECLLAGHPDPLRQQTFRGVPAQTWLDRAMKEAR
ncbi:MAG TPA: sulfatase [Acidimicrobiales bacterium]|nr:sulfatase [Acidimicrobiales bacterium]